MAAMKQNPLTMLVPVSARGRADVLSTIENLSPRIVSGFKKSPSTHFARLVFLPDSNRILFTSNFDGDAGEYVKELAAAVGQEMDPVWRCCDGYTADAATDPKLFQEFLDRHTVKVDTFYAALPGVNVKSICESASLRQSLTRELNGSISNSPLLNQLPQTSTPKKPLAGGANLKEDLGRVLEWIVGIREGAQEEAVVRTQEGLYGIEDLFVQNQMTVIVPVKKRWLSRLILRIVLWVVNGAAARARGSLSGITTIHFARWTVIDGGENLLFESNYDGSWESYIDDFVDSASLGMNLIWGNCIGFPKGGSRDVEAFKAYIRVNQIPSQMFYSAYEDLTMKNILTDLAISGLVPTYAVATAKEQFKHGVYIRGASA